MGKALCVDIDRNYARTFALKGERRCESDVGIGGGDQGCFARKTHGFFKPAFVYEDHNRLHTLHTLRLNLYQLCRQGMHRKILYRAKGARPMVR